MCWTFFKGFGLAGPARPVILLGGHTPTPLLGLKWSWGGPNSGSSATHQNYNNVLRVDQSNRGISRSEIQSRDINLPDSTKKQKELVRFSDTVVAHRPTQNNNLLGKKLICFVHKTRTKFYSQIVNKMLAHKMWSKFYSQNATKYFSLYFLRTYSWRVYYVQRM